MSLPRLLSIRDGDLHAEPLPGWETLTDAPQPLTPTQDQLTHAAGQHFILRLRCRVQDAPATIVFLSDDSKHEQTVLTLAPDGTLMLDRSASTASGEPVTTPITRTVPLSNGAADLFLCVDGTAIECMVNGHWLSGRVYPQHSGGQLTIRADEAAATLYPIHR